MFRLQKLHFTFSFIEQIWSCSGINAYGKLIPHILPNIIYFTSVFLYFNEFVCEGIIYSIKSLNKYNKLVAVHIFFHDYEHLTALIIENTVDI